MNVPHLRVRVSLLLLGAVLLGGTPSVAQDEGTDTLPTIAEKTKGMEQMDGYFPVHWDAQTGTLWLEIPRFAENFLYVTSLPTGLGSNPVGLDRGQVGTQRVVRFERTGPKVLLVAPNLDYRASTTNSAARQRNALDALLSTITPSALALPKAARERIPPRPPGHPSNRELFKGRTGPTFDPYAPAGVAATMVLDALTVPERAMRLIEQHDAHAELPGLRETLTQITDAVWKTEVPDDAYRAELQRTVQQVWTDVLLDRADGAELSPAVRARLEQHLRTLQDWLAAHPGTTPEAEAHRTTIQASSARFLDRSRETTTQPASIEPPPGSPIGQGPGSHRRHAQRQAWLDRWGPAPHVCSGLR